MTGRMQAGLLVLIQSLMGKVTLDSQASFLRHPDEGLGCRKENRGLAVYKNWTTLGTG
ncbi:MAG: hypothetical protein WA477_02115 [Candidatus Sulfotelmatobacter sp.]